MSDTALLTTLMIGNTQVTISELRSAISQLPPEQFFDLLRKIIEAGRADQLREVIDALEIMATPSAFDDQSKIQAIESVARDYPLSWWLAQTGQSLSRNAVIGYWNFFLEIAANRGYCPGNINPAGQSTNLWKATGHLAQQMLADPAAYCYLPAILINNSEQVGKALSEIPRPKAFLEVLTGEAFDDMAKSPDFLSAFSTIEDRQTPEGAVATLMLALQA